MRRQTDAWYRLAEAETRAVREALPARLRECVAELPIVYMEFPSPGLRGELEGGDVEGLLGLFTGPPYGESLLSNDTHPPMIELFIGNLRLEARDDPAAFRREVRTTLLHEIGHYLGLDEEGLAERDLE